MGRDRANGRISLHFLTLGLDIEWPVQPNLPLYDAEERFVEVLAQKMGGNAAMNPFWRFARLPVSVHNLGGCPIADSPDQGVANAYGEVFGYPGMFALDGAAIPVAIGANPSHTITAMAERNIEAAIRRILNDPNWHAPEAPAPPVEDPLSNVVIPPEGVPPLPLTTGASTQPPVTLALGPRRTRMKVNIDPAISSRIVSAWKALSPDQRSRIAPILAKANQRALTAVQSRVAPIFDSSVPHQALLAHSAISNDRDGVLSNLEAGVVIDVDAAGEIWGTGRYQQLDPGWAETIAVWLENLTNKHAFNSSPATIPIPDSLQIAIAGDWGTGDWRTASNPAPSTDVAHHIEFLQPHLTIHLGDVYYAGTAEQEQHLLVNLWPQGSLGALALNSNHEMYSGASPYFQIALASSRFGLQRGCSFFALETPHWVIVGLDSVYFSDAEKLYMDGSLCTPGGPTTQLDFLKEQATKGKKVILLTHHNGLSEDGLSATGLWLQVMNAFPDGIGPAYWYWGHVHAGVVYKPYGAGQVLCRCSGHGAVPWGQASMLGKSPNVAWYENRSARDPDIPERVLNGFTVLRLDGADLKEIFYDENGGIAWES